MKIDNKTVDFISLIFAIMAIIFVVVALYFFTFSTSKYLGIGILGVALSYAVASRWLYGVSKKGDIK